MRDTIRKDNWKIFTKWKTFPRRTRRDETFFICELRIGELNHVYRILKVKAIDLSSNSDSEGLNGNYELSDSSSDSEVDGDTGGTSY